MRQDHSKIKNRPIIVRKTAFPSSSLIIGHYTVSVQFASKTHNKPYDDMATVIKIKIESCVYLITDHVTYLLFVQLVNLLTLWTAGHLNSN